MNWLDFVIIGIIALSAVIGLIRGLIKEVLSLVIWVGAFWVAGRFYSDVAGFLPNIQDEMVRNGIATTVLFIATLVIGAMANFVIGQLVSKTGLSGTNMLFGVVFGGFRGVLMVALLLFLLDSFTALSSSDDWARSQLIPHFAGVIQWFFVYLEQSSSFLPKLP